MVKGVSKYTINDIVDGKRTLANGSIAGYVMDAKGQRVWTVSYTHLTLPTKRIV